MSSRGSTVQKDAACSLFLGERLGMRGSGLRRKSRAAVWGYGPAAGKCRACPLPDDGAAPGRGRGALACGRIALSGALLRVEVPVWLMTALVLATAGGPAAFSAATLGPAPAMLTASLLSATSLADGQLVRDGLNGVDLVCAGAVAAPWPASVLASRLGKQPGWLRAVAPGRRGRAGGRRSLGRDAAAASTTGRLQPPNKRSMLISWQFSAPAHELSQRAASRLPHWAWRASAWPTCFNPRRPFPTCPASRRPAAAQPRYRHS